MASVSRPVPGAPSDNDTLQAVLAEFAADGWDGEAVTRPGGIVHWRRCGHDTPAAAVEVATARRMEGASDPDDMLAVVAAPCPVCGDRGVLVLRYGPTAGADDSDVLVQLEC